jgi:hypothetical protein
LRVSIVGVSKNIANDEVREITRFFASLLFSKKFLRDLSFRIKFVPIKDCAECQWIGNPDRPRRFEILIRETNTKAKVVQSLAHEMGHARQYLIGRLRDYLNKTDVVKWEGEVVPFNDEDNFQYYLSPWEIDANGVEIGLYNLYKKHFKKRES